MNFSWVRPFLFRSKQFLVKNAPGILMGMGTVGSVTSVIFAIKATPAAWNAHADAVLEKTAKREGVCAAEVETRYYKDEAMRNNPDYIPRIPNGLAKLTISETVKACGKYYIPAIGLELFSLMCFWGAHGIDVRRQAVLAGLYSTAEETLREYQKKVQDSFGKESERQVRTDIAQDHANQNPPPSMVFEADTDVWCRYKGYKFRSNYNRLKEIQNDANQQLIKHMYYSERELLWLFDPDHKWIVPDSDSGQVGWTVDDLLHFDILPSMNADHTPGFEIDILDEEGRKYPPKPGFCNFG